MRSLMAAAAISAVLACPCLDGLTCAIEAQSDRELAVRSTEDPTFYRAADVRSGARLGMRVTRQASVARSGEEAHRA